uniref:Magnesium transporter NIPA2 n=1 Tax=Macrostomum lignano TaxID=282301 RepID=A0A1I8IQF5_9PLAT
MVSSASNGRFDFYIGLFLAMSSSLYIGTSFILKKKALIRLSNRGIRAGEGGYGYLRDVVWWSGFLMMAAGEGANFAAYAFAPASLVTPLGALSVLVSAMLASKFLNERLNLLGKIGCLVCLLGLHYDCHSRAQRAGGFISYVAIVLAASAVLIFYFAPRYGRTNPLVYITISGSLGSLSVMGCKGTGVAIKQTFAGDNVFVLPVTWLLIASVLFFVTVQMNYLNKALDIFNTSVVSPILYVFFTTFVIIASSILYKEWFNMKPEDVLGNLVGFSTIISGIFLLNAFKEHDISLSNLNVPVHRTDPAVGGGGVVVRSNGVPAPAHSPFDEDQSHVGLLTGDGDDSSQEGEQAHIVSAGSA